MKPVSVASTAGCQTEFLKLDEERVEVVDIQHEGQWLGLGVNYPMSTACWHTGVVGGDVLGA